MSKSSLALLFGSDSDKEINGVVVQYGPVKVRLARLGGANEKFQKLFEAKSRPWRAMIDADLLPPEQAKKIMFESFAEGIVLSWEGVTDDNGEPLEFNVANCVAQFAKFPGFFTYCSNEASKLANYRSVEVETADTKN